MVSVIVLGIGSPDEVLERTLASISTAKPEQIILVSESDGGKKVGALQISPSGRKAGAALSEAIKASKHEKLIILNGEVPLAAKDVTVILKSIEESSLTPLQFLAIETPEGLIDLPLLNQGNIVMALTTKEKWPLACLVLNRSLYLNSPIEGDTAPQAMFDLILKTLVENRGVKRLPKTAHLTGDISDEQFAMTSEMALQGLRALIANCNIESLFPEHPWAKHQKESAAACYHTLAALFLRLGDINSAGECLSLSDQLEDSPRSLALKGLISVERGETLGAVANMVSSLQQYEVRKKPDENHYLTFAPKDIEAINSNLNAGLEALNSRNNEAAVEHFAKAIFNFDPFYAQYGLNKVTPQ